MYSYSPIKSLRIKNFRNIGSVDIDFSQCPIVTLLGENESGKTSVIKAFSMCALHDNPREQKDYIRDGTKMLGIEINLEDGTQVVRVKEANGINMYRVVKPDGTVWDADKITDGLPKEVQDVMGLIAEPETGEYLHVRTYEDKLLFVVTPSSTNYKVMYNALKVEQLTRAIKIGSSEVNELKAKVTTNNNSIITLNDQLRGIKVYDVETLVNIRDRIVSQVNLLEKAEKILSLKERMEQLINELGVLRLIDMYSLKEISESIASKINSISRLANNISKMNNFRIEYDKLNSISEIDIRQLNKIDELRNKSAELNKKINEAYKLRQVLGISEISERVTEHIAKFVTLDSKIKQLKEKANIIDTTGVEMISEQSLSGLSKASKIVQDLEVVKAKTAELSQYNDYIIQVENYLKQCGVAVEICPKCGEQVIFDVSKLGS